jgi:endo-1,3(4)-beta-glucanase
MLLAPSAGSTERPTRSNLSGYGASDDSDDSVPQNDSSASFELLLPRKSDQERGKSKIQRFFRNKRRVMIAATLLALSGVVAVICSCLGRSSGGVSSGLSGAKKNIPFSTLDPVKDLGLYPLSRPEDSRPPHALLGNSQQQAWPTNAWYQNLLLVRGEPSDVQRAYTMPYILDLVGPVPGLRAHPNHLDASTNVVQLSFVDSHGLTLGAVAPDLDSSKPPSNRYSVVSTTALAATLKWHAFPMSASIVKGMPYTTMHYPKPLSMLPTIASEMKLSSPPLADGTIKIKCEKGKATRVESELQLSFQGSDFTWLVFFSQPVNVKCIEQPEGLNAAEVILQVTELADTDDGNSSNLEDLTVRAALLNSCTNGENQIFCGHQKSASNIKEFAKLLRERAHLYPGPNADVDYDIDSEMDEAILKFDWDVHNMRVQSDGGHVAPASYLRRDADGGTTNDDTEEQQVDLITYALPHHLPRMSNDYTPWGKDKFCTTSLIGPICLANGSSWHLAEELPPLAFQAPRPPRTETVNAIANALSTDLSYHLAHYYQRGAGDTYFSGKMLARMARVLLVAEELINLCNPKAHGLLDYALSPDEAKDYAKVCKSIKLPSQDEMNAAVSRLRSSTEVWINGTAETPFVYDSHWGGVISCGCQFDSKTSACSNQFPECPSIQDPGMNFGNGFYNDHHFHYGYHIYAAATVSHFDNDWGRKHFEQVLYLVRDIANPSEDDVYFPKCRQKDWYQGNSWASGVVRPFPNGRNQESSSEAIAAYEAVSLFGNEMMTAWNNERNTKNAEVAARIRDIGRLLTATEIRAADYYWHVRKHDESMQIYPAIYAQSAVGMLWTQMAQFQTWFGSAAFLAIGIQLLPLTAISESRDKPSWIRELYPEFAESCGAVDDCITQGWSVLQLATLATVGHADLAVEKAKELPDKVFESAGGNGHSMTNTLWYYATRPKAEPIELPKEKKHESIEEEKKMLVDCGLPDQCTDEVLDRDAKGSSCRTRMTWLMIAMGYSEQHACHRVAGGEFPTTCGACDPGEEAALDDHSEENNGQCSPCTKEECLSDLNRCPRYETTFVCTKGQNVGGCSKTPWNIDSGLCSSCCEVSSCRDYENFESNAEPEPALDDDRSGPSAGCGECDKEICTSKLNLCPMHSAPFLCVAGKNKGGCSPWKWDIGECEKCCDLKLTCG